MVRKSQKEKSLGRSWCRSESDIKMKLGGIGYEDKRLDLNGQG
jgi:hypothetical protein